jgi:hypothetical protein
MIPCVGLGDVVLLLAGSRSTARGLDCTCCRFALLLGSLLYGCLFGFQLFKRLADVGRLVIIMFSLA